MPDLIKKFSKATEKIFSKKNDIREGVYCAYVDHLSDISTDDLPEDVQIIYESVTERLMSAEPAGKVSDDEANWIAEDILYMADGIRINNKP
jgi:hypothetical protein